MEIIRNFTTKRRGITIEDSVKLTYTDEDLSVLDGIDPETYWLSHVGRGNVVKIQKVAVQWDRAGKYEEASSYNTYIEVTTKTGVACFANLAKEPLAFISNQGEIHLWGLAVGRKWKGRCGHAIPWVRAQANPSGRRSMINTDSEKVAPSQCLAAMVVVMREDKHLYRNRVINKKKVTAVNTSSEEYGVLMEALWGAVSEEAKKQGHTATVKPSDYNNGNSYEINGFAVYFLAGIQVKRNLWGKGYRVHVRGVAQGGADNCEFHIHNEAEARTYAAAIVQAAAESAAAEPLSRERSRREHEAAAQKRAFMEAKQAEAEAEWKAAQAS